MTAYIVSQLTIHDRSEYDKYEAGFPAAFAKYDGTMLSVDEDPTVLAGEWTATRSVVIEFPSKRSAIAFLKSPEYQAISVHRDAGSTASSILVNGFEPD